jgi:hypothetical protein
LVSWRHTIEQALSSSLLRTTSHFPEALRPLIFQHIIFQTRLSIRKIRRRGENCRHNRAELRRAPHDKDSFQSHQRQKQVCAHKRARVNAQRIRLQLCLHHQPMEWSEQASAAACRWSTH